MLKHSVIRNSWTAHALYKIISSDKRAHCILGPMCAFVSIKTYAQIILKQFPVSTHRLKYLSVAWIQKRGFCDSRTRFVVTWKHLCLILFTGTRVRIDSVMRPRSSVIGGTIQVPQLQLQLVIYCSRQTPLVSDYFVDFFRLCAPRCEFLCALLVQCMACAGRSQVICICVHEYM